MPGKLVEKIWRREYIDLNSLLPHRLGAPEPTLAEALQGRTREDKQITSIEQWLVCFSSYASVLVLKHPTIARDLFAYQAMIVKAAHDYEGTPWLSYDAHFRSLAATIQSTNWNAPDQAIWSQYFSRAIPRRVGSSALSVRPYSDLGTRHNDSPCRKRSFQKEVRASPYSRTAPICVHWNLEGCRSPDCTYRHVCLSCHGTCIESQTALKQHSPDATTEHHLETSSHSPFGRKGRIWNWVKREYGLCKARVWTG